MSLRYHLNDAAIRTMGFVHMADRFYFRRLALVVIAAVMLLLAFVGFCKYSFFFSILSRKWPFFCMFLNTC
jgi:hypothetical protein